MSSSVHSSATTTLASIPPYMAEEDDLEGGNFIEIRNYEEALQHSQEALTLQTEGKFREAMSLYRRINNGIEHLFQQEHTLTPEEYTQLDKLKNQHFDAMLAINYALDFGVTPSVPGRENGRFASYDELLRDYQMMLCSTMYNLIFHPISLPLAIAVICLHFQSVCNSKLVLVGSILYLPLSVFSIVLSLKLRMRLKEINYDYKEFDRVTRTAHARGTFGYMLETFDSYVSVLKFAWFIYVICVLFKENEHCGASDEAYQQIFDLFISLIVLSSLEYWFLALVISCLPVLCCLGCVVVYRYYQHYKKTRPVGMNEDALQRIESRSFHEGMFDKDYDTCAICLCEFDEAEADRIRVLPCSGKHVFHKACIDTWLIKNDTCPQCREHLIEQIKKIKQNNDEV